MRALAAALSGGVELAFLCSPQMNPTGRRVAQPVLEAILRRAEEEKVWLGVDECFLPTLRRRRRGADRPGLDFPGGWCSRVPSHLLNAMPRLRLG